MNVVKDKWLSVSMKADKTANIKIHGTIGGGWFEDGVTDAQVEADLEDIKDLKADTIIVDLDSLGGSVKHGMKIYNLLKSNNAKIVVNITGWTASMGTVIAMAGDEVKMVDNTFFLVHEARTVSVGTKSQIESDAKFLGEINKQIASIYSKRTGMSVKDAELLMAINGGEGEFWSAKETKKKGFVDSIYKPESNSKAAAMLTETELHEFKIKANINLKQDKMKFNLTKVKDIVTGAWKAGMSKMSKEEQTDENIEALIATSTELVVESLQANVDEFKTEQEAKLTAKETELSELQAKYNKLVADGSDGAGDDANLGDDAKLSSSDLAAKEFVNGLSESDKLIMTSKEN